MRDKPIETDGPSDQDRGQVWWGPLLGVLGAVLGATVGGVIGLIVFFVMRFEGGQRGHALGLAFFFILIVVGAITGTFCGLLYGLALEAKHPTSDNSKDESWAGKMVALMDNAPIWLSDENGQALYDDDGQPCAVAAKNVTYLVLKDEDGDLLVRQDGKEGWIDKHNAILIEKSGASFFTALIRADPNDAEAYNRRAGVWWQKGEHEVALTDLDNAIRLQPDKALYYFNRGSLYLSLNQDQKAISDLNEAIQLNPEYADAFARRGGAYRRLKEYPQAISDYSESIRLDSNLSIAHNGLAWLLATCPEANYRDGKKAVESAMRACELTNWKVAGMIDTLAAAYAESGDFDNAVKHQSQALEDPECQKRYGENGCKPLELYKERKPYRE